MNDKKISIISSIICLVYGISIYIGSSTIHSDNPNGVGADFMPRIIGSIIICLSLFIVISTIVSMKKGQNDSEPKEAIDSGTRKTIMTIVLLIAYAFLLKYTGFVITSIVYLILQMIILADKVRKKDLLLYGVISVITPLLVNYVFVHIFSLMLPSGILG